MALISYTLLPSPLFFSHTLTPHRHFKSLTPSLQHLTSTTTPPFSYPTLSRSLAATMSADEASKTRCHSNHHKIPHVLTVAGSDSGAGAGIQADIKACGALGVYCSSVITAVTAQNTVGVQGVHPVPEDFVVEQLISVLSDMEVDVVKTGMLPSVGIITVLCHKLKDFPIRALVVDPVMVSTSGDTLVGPSTLTAFRDELLPLADIVTPNLKEASALLGGLPLESVSDMHSAARMIHNLGPRNVLVKGGDLPDSSDAIDIFFDGEQCHELRGSRIQTRNTHGTGCTLASCIAAELAKGSPMLQAVQAAKGFVERALHYSKDIAIGNGPQGPFDHFLRLKNRNLDATRKPRFDANSLFLYAVTDSGMNKKWGRSIADAVKASIEGGATIVQLRLVTSTIFFLGLAKNPGSGGITIWCNSSLPSPDPRFWSNFQTRTQPCFFPISKQCVTVQIFMQFGPSTTWFVQILNLVMTRFFWILEPRTGPDPVLTPFVRISKLVMSQSVRIFKPAQNPVKSNPNF